MGDTCTKGTASILTRSPATSVRRPTFRNIAVYGDHRMAGPSDEDNLHLRGRVLRNSEQALDTSDFFLRDRTYWGMLGVLAELNSTAD